MRTLYYFLLFILLISCSDKNKFADCKRYHVGNFYYKYPDGRKEVKMERVGLFEVETDLKSGEKIKKSITWKSECKCDVNEILEESKPIWSENDKMSSQTFKVGPPIHIEIVGGNDNFYIFKRKLSGNRTFRDTVWVNKSNN
jgi:hypothetical protein